MSMVRMSTLAAPLAKVSNFSLIVPLNIMKAVSTARNMAVTEGNW